MARLVDLRVRLVLVAHENGIVLGLKSQDNQHEQCTYCRDSKLINRTELMR